MASALPSAPEEGPQPRDAARQTNIVSGRSHGRQRAVLMSASGQFRGRLRAVSRDRRHSALFPGLVVFVGVCPVELGAASGVAVQRSRPKIGRGWREVSRVRLGQPMIREATRAVGRRAVFATHQTQPDHPRRKCGDGQEPRRFPCSLSIRSTKEEPNSVPAASPRLPRSTSPWPPGEHPHAHLGFDPVWWTPRKRGSSPWEDSVGSSLLSTRTRP